MALMSGVERSPRPRIVAHGDLGTVLEQPDYYRVDGVGKEGVRDEFADAFQNALGQIDEHDATQAFAFLLHTGHEAVVLLAERLVAARDHLTACDLFQRTRQEVRHELAEEAVVPVVLDDADQLHHWRDATDCVLRRGETRRVHHVRPAHQLRQLWHLHSEAFFRDVADQLRA
jgi:hypothetical protein